MVSETEHSRKHDCAAFMYIYFLTLINFEFAKILGHTDAQITHNAYSRRQTQFLFVQTRT